MNNINPIYLEEMNLKKGVTGLALGASLVNPFTSKTAHAIESGVSRTSPQIQRSIMDEFGPEIFKTAFGNNMRGSASAKTRAELARPRAELELASLFNKETKGVAPKSYNDFYWYLRPKSFDLRYCRNRLNEFLNKSEDYNALKEVFNNLEMLYSSSKAITPSQRKEIFLSIFDPIYNKYSHASPSEQKVMLTILKRASETNRNAGLKAEVNSLIGNLEKGIIPIDGLYYLRPSLFQ